MISQRDFKNAIDEINKAFVQVHTELKIVKDEIASLKEDKEEKKVNKKT